MKELLNILRYRTITADFEHTMGCGYPLKNDIEYRSNCIKILQDGLTRTNLRFEERETI